MKKKVLIIQGYNTPYRNGLFNAIAAFEDIDLTLLYISKKGDDRKWHDDYVSRFREVRVNSSVQQASYVETTTRLNYIDYVRKLLWLRPDVVIFILSKHTILLHYLMLWKKCHLIHWSEATFVKESGVNWFKQKRYLNLHLALPKAFLFPGKLAEEYHNYCGFDLAGKVFYAPNSVDEEYGISSEELDRKYASVSPLKILFVGSFVEQKGFDIINRVFGRLRDAGVPVELHLAGDGPLVPDSRAINHGYLNRGEILQLYKSCHVFVMPSIADCNPLSLIEAAKTGNVIVASRGVGNYPEMIRGNGYVFDIGDENELSVQLMRLLSITPESLKLMGRLSVELAKGISHEETAKAFHSAISFVCKSS